MDKYQFPQADNLEFVYQIFTELPEEGLNRYTFSEKYKLADRQGAYYLNAICFIGLAEKIGKDTVLSERGRIVRLFAEPFRRKVFLLAILENRFICETYQMCKNKDRTEKDETIQILIEGTYGLKEETTKKRRTRTLLSWFKWFDEQEFHIEESYYE